jgi:hypothetical protein
MEDEDFRTMEINQSQMKVFRDGRIHTYDKRFKTWIDRKFQTNKAYHGYCKVGIGGKYYFVHNIITLCYLGEKPTGFQTDHINGVRLDNRLENLQYLTHTQNTRERKTMNNRPIKGYYKTKYGRFLAHITVDYKTIYLGTHATEEEARQAYVDAKLKYHQIEI